MFHNLLKILLLLILANNLVSAAAGANSQQAGGASGTACNPCDVSMIQLISNPKGFDGKNIAVIGYLVLRGAQKYPTLYLSEQSARDGIETEGLSVYVAEDDPIVMRARSAVSTFGFSRILAVGIFDAKNFEFSIPRHFGSLHRAILQDLHDLPPLNEGTGE